MLRFEWYAEPSPETCFSIFLSPILGLSITSLRRSQPGTGESLCNHPPTAYFAGVGSDRFWNQQDLDEVITPGGHPYCLVGDPVHLLWSSIPEHRIPIPWGLGNWPPSLSIDCLGSVSLGWSLDHK